MKELKQAYLKVVAMLGLNPIGTVINSLNAKDLLCKSIDWFLHDGNFRAYVFCKKVVLKNFAKFRGKHLCQSLFFNKVAGLKPATLLKKRLWHRCFPVNFTKFLRTTFFTEHLWRLLLVHLKR